MDRRTWIQLITILATVREAEAQQRGGTAPPDAAVRGGGRGQGFQQQPMRIEKAQVEGALKLLGLDFQDTEIDTMMRGVNQALYTYQPLFPSEGSPNTERAFT